MFSINRAFAAFRTTLLFVSVVFTLELASAVSTDLDKDEPVHFSLIVSGALTLKPLGIVSAVDEALEFIENEGTILHGYSLQYAQVLDAQVRCKFGTDINSSDCNKAVAHNVGMTTR